MISFENITQRRSYNTNNSMVHTFQAVMSCHTQSHELTTTTSSLSINPLFLSACRTQKK